MTILSLVTAAFVGLLSGAHASIWGMYKDAVHEGFAWPTFFRSMIIGSVSAMILHAVLAVDVAHASGLFMLFGLAYALERGIVETWKTFVRDEDQSKYFIPMQFSIRGVPVRNRAVRLAAGAGYTLVVGAAVWALLAAGPIPRDDFALRVIGLGLAAGFLVAVGGGWKDAPKEGFSLVKFFRSPTMTVAYAIVLSFMTTNALIIAAGSIGFERATAETWKTFFFPSKPRGKFAGKPVVDPGMLDRRHDFVPAYVAIWLMVIGSGWVAIRDVLGGVTEVVR